MKWYPAAVHEAAHALAVAEAGWDIERITTRADGSGETAHSCPPLDIDDAGAAERDLLVSLVGAAASDRWYCIARAMAPGAADVSPGDDDDAEEMILRLARLRGLSRWAVAETERRRARAWVEDHLPAIGALAESLAWHDGELRGAECRKAIGAAVAGRAWVGPIVQAPATFPAETSADTGAWPDPADAAGLAFAAKMAGGPAQIRRYASFAALSLALGRRHRWRRLF